MKQPLVMFIGPMIFLMSLSTWAMDTKLNISLPLPADRINQFIQVTNATGDKEFIKNPNYDWATWEKKTKSGEWDISKAKPSASQALEENFGADIYWKLSKTLGGTSSDLWSGVYNEINRIYSNMDPWNEDSVAKWKAIVSYVLENGSKLGANVLKDNPTTSTISNVTATAATTPSAPEKTITATSPGPTKTATQEAAVTTAMTAENSDHATYYKEMITSLKKVKANINEKSNYLKNSNKNWTAYKGKKSLECSQVKKAETVADARIQTNCVELKKLEDEEVKTQAQIDSVAKIQASLPSGSTTSTGNAAIATTSSPNGAATASTSNNCLLKIDDYKDWGFTRIAMAGSGGSSMDNPKQREVSNGQTATIESASMIFQNPCVNGSPWTNWASDSKIHSLYEKSKGKRILGLICRNGKLLTEGLRNRPEGTEIDKMLYGCNGSCEEKIVKCPDTNKTCILPSIGNKNYLDGEEVTVDFWNMDSYSASNLPYKLEAYGSANNPSIVSKYADIGTCKTGTTGYAVTKMGKFICDSAQNQWKYIGDVIKSDALASRESLGGVAGLPQSMINQLPECSSKGVNIGDTKALSNNVVGTFTNPAVPAPRFLIIENPWSSTLSFDANGYQGMKGTLSAISKKVFRGIANHVPTGCNSNIPFELTLSFTTLDEAKYESVIMEEGCGMTKGQVFTGVFTKIK